jgi:hypothetical protein
MMGGYVGRLIQRSILFLFVISYCLVPATLFADDYEKACRLLSDAKDRVDRLSDYTLTITSQERVGGKLLPEATMFVKFKRPFSVYIRNLTGKHVNREIIYVKGKYNNKMIVSPGGILGMLTARVSPYTKGESRHAITESGLPNTIGRMVTILEEGETSPSCRAAVTYLGEGYSLSEKVIRVRIVDSSYAPKTELALNAVTLFPVEIVSYDTSGSVLESYRYHDIKPNVGLTDADFDPKNTAYHF